jgi:Na+-translocating ferredoxin:NAD+ oxidoreductase RnfD subunit
MKTYFYIITGITGGILLLKVKKLGWIISIPYLLVFTVLASWGMLFSIKMHTYGSLAFLGSVWILLLLSLYFLLRPQGSKKFRVSKTTVLPTLAFLVLIIVLYFFLQ